MKAFAEAETLDKFNNLLLAEASESEIQSSLDSFRGVLIELLRKHYPRRNYDSTEAWIEALKQVIFDKLMPQAIEIRYQEEQQLQEPAPGGLVPEMASASSPTKSSSTNRTICALCRLQR